MFSFPRIATRLTTAKCDVVHKTRSIITYRRRTEPQPQWTCTKIVNTGPAVPEICSRTDRHTQTNWSQYTAPLPVRSNNNYMKYVRWLIRKCFVQPGVTHCTKQTTEKWMRRLMVLMTLNYFKLYNVAVGWYHNTTWQAQHSTGILCALRSILTVHLPRAHSNWPVICQFQPHNNNIDYFEPTQWI